MNSSPLPYECQSYLEIDSLEELRLPKVVASLGEPTLFQFKYDGIWALVQVESGIARVFSKTGQCKHSFPVGTQDKVTLIGEYMYGSQWSKAPERTGRIFIFDCVLSNGVDISSAAYRDRYRIAAQHVVELGFPFERVPAYSLPNLSHLWPHIVKEETWEGVVIRGADQTFDATLVKLKRSVQDDFVVLGFVEGKGKHAGRLGALRLGQFISGTKQIIEVGDVGGGFTDGQREQIWQRQNFFRGQVALVEGKSRFDSGALRHPTFIRFRGDKLPEECVLKRSS